MFGFGGGDSSAHASLPVLCVRLDRQNLVVEMTRSASVSRLKSEFDDFLFAPIGEERNGMLLSVLSALARLDVDPWQEAADLARLPRDSATQRLTALIAETAWRTIGVSGPRFDCCSLDRALAEPG